MHALSRASSVTGDPQYFQWAVEPAKGVHPAFVRSPRPGGRKRMFWKMSTGLSRPAVPSMGQHDPLDGPVTCSELAAGARKREARSDLDGEIADLAKIVRGGSLTTGDPLGAGGLLSDAWRTVQLAAGGGFDHPGLLEDVLDPALLGTRSIAESDLLGLPAEHRLAFRELGLSIGLKGIERTRDHLARSPERSSREAAQSVEAFSAFLPLAGKMDGFWRSGRNRGASTWKEHRKINMVMLAASLAPEEFLRA